MKCKLYSRFSDQEVPCWLEITPGCSGRDWAWPHCTKWLYHLKSLSWSFLNLNVRGWKSNPLHYRRDTFLPSLEQVLEFKKPNFFYNFFFSKGDTILDSWSLNSQYSFGSYPISYPGKIGGWSPREQFPDSRDKRTLLVQRSEVLELKEGADPNLASEMEFKQAGREPRKLPNSEAF